MANLGSRIVGALAVLAFLLLLPFIFTGIAVIIVALFLLAALAGLLFYIRIRLALRRFRKAFEKAQAAQASQVQGTAPAPPRNGHDVLDAEFKVKE